MHYLLTWTSRDPAVRCGAVVAGQKSLRDAKKKKPSLYSVYVDADHPPDSDDTANEPTNRATNQAAPFSTLSLALIYTETINHQTLSPLGERGRGVYVCMYVWMNE